ncbi:MAG TPA: hypothetical protein VEJ20_07440, partial [Candidatus Eremiobacteraceae bacterium]|nr:hypothetical protein [Candidatus Eremiobacteraceae bacterium]
RQIRMRSPAKIIAAAIAQSKAMARPQIRHKRGAASARIRQAHRLPIYEPHMGADGKLHPGAPYSPPAKG